MSCCSLLLAGCTGETMFLMFEQHLETPDGELPLGSGCESIGEGSSGTAGAASVGPAFSIEHEGHGDDGVRVVVRDGKGVLLTFRNYSDDFLLSDDVDEFAVELDDQHSLRLRYWGGLDCEAPSETGERRQETREPE